MEFFHLSATQTCVIHSKHLLVKLCFGFLSSCLSRPSFVPSCCARDWYRSCSFGGNVCRELFACCSTTVETNVIVLGRKIRRGSLRPSRRSSCQTLTLPRRCGSRRGGAQLMFARYILVVSCVLFCFCRRFLELLCPKDALPEVCI